MALINSKMQSNKYIKTIVIILFIALAIYLAILIWSASTLSGSTNKSALQQGRFGPLSLFELSKQQVSSGEYQATIKFFQGSTEYMVMWVIFGLVFAGIRPSLAKKY